LSMRHSNFMNLSVRHCTMSLGQFFFKFFLSVGHCVVSHRQIHEIRVSHRQKQVEQCFLDQTINEGYPVDKFPK
jgi:hypothetical protein